MISVISVRSFSRRPRAPHAYHCMIAITDHRNKVRVSSTIRWQSSSLTVCLALKFGTNHDPKCFAYDLMGIELLRGSSAETCNSAAKNQISAIS